MARRYKNELERAYFRERDRIRKALERMEQRGIFQIGKMTNKDILPKIPKRITKQSLSRLQKMTTQKLYKTAELVSLETGEILARGKNIKRVEREYKRAQRESGGREFTGDSTKSTRKYKTADLIFDNIISDIEKMNSSITGYMITELYVLKDKVGVGRVAKLIEENAQEFHEIIDRATGQYERHICEPLARQFDALLRKAVEAYDANILNDPRMKAASLNLRVAANNIELSD